MIGDRPGAMDCTMTFSWIADEVRDRPELGCLDEGAGGTVLATHVLIRGLVEGAPYLASFRVSTARSRSVEVRAAARGGDVGLTRPADALAADAPENGRGHCQQHRCAGPSSWSRSSFHVSQSFRGQDAITGELERIHAARVLRDSGAREVAVPRVVMPSWAS